MLPAQNRVRASEDFRRAFRTGSKSGSRQLVLHAVIAAASLDAETEKHMAVADVATSDESHAPRVGFVVSKAVGNAVVRNRVKRRLRDIVHHRLARLAPGLYVFRALPAAASASYAELGDTVDRLLASAQRKAERTSGTGRRETGRWQVPRTTSAAIERESEGR